MPLRRQVLAWVVVGGALVGVLLVSAAWAVYVREGARGPR